MDLSTTYLGLKLTNPIVPSAGPLSRSLDGMRRLEDICVIQGMIKLVLYDPREGSPTKGEIDEFFIGVHNPLLVQVPNEIYHGWKCISEEEAIILNVPTEVYIHDAPDDAHGLWCLWNYTAREAQHFQWQMSSRGG